MTDELKVNRTAVRLPGVGILSADKPVDHSLLRWWLGMRGVDSADAVNGRLTKGGMFVPEPANKP